VKFEALVESMTLKFQKQSALKFVSGIDPAKGGGYRRYPWSMTLKFQKQYALKFASGIDPVSEAYRGKHHMI
jgi:hypothetical protein